MTNSPMTDFPSSLFDERRTSQAAAFFLNKAGGRLPLLKLMKLLYLAERESLRMYGEPISGDKLVSMPHGPVLSRTLDMMNGYGGQAQGGWNEWIEDRSGHELALRDPSMIRTPQQDLLALSDGDLDILEAVWARFGHMGTFALVEYTHSSACPEWEDPQGSSYPIALDRVLQAVGYQGPSIRAVSEHLNEQANLRAALVA